MTALEGPTNLLVIVPCGQRKLWDEEPTHGPVEARCAYTSPVFRLNRQYAEHFGDTWVILSAKHGFIRPEFLIPCAYNVTFKRRTIETVSIETLRQQVEEYGLDRHTAVVGLGGKEYREIVMEAFVGRSVQLLFPFEKGRIGEKMQAIRRAIKANDYRGNN